MPFGAATGAVNIAPNVHGVEVERGLGKPVMGSLHGVWSLGGVIGGAVITAALAAGTDVRTLMVSVAVTVIVVSLAPGPFLLTASTPGRDDAGDTRRPVAVSAGHDHAHGRGGLRRVSERGDGHRLGRRARLVELAAEPATASAVLHLLRGGDDA